MFLLRNTFVLVIVGLSLFQSPLALAYSRGRLSYDFKKIEATQKKFSVSLKTQRQSLRGTQKPFQGQVNWATVRNSKVFSQGKLNPQEKLRVQSLDGHRTAFLYEINVEKQLQSIHLNYDFGFTQSWRIGFSLPLGIYKTHLKVTKSYSEEFLQLQSKGLTNTTEENKLLFGDIYQKNFNPIQKEEERLVFLGFGVRSLNQILKTPRQNILLLNALNIPLESPESNYDLFYDPNLEPTVSYQMGLSSSYYVYKTLYVQLVGSLIYHMKNEFIAPKYYGDGENLRVIQKKAMERLGEFSMGFRKKQLSYQWGYLVEQNASTSYGGARAMKAFSEATQRNQESLFLSMDYSYGLKSNSVLDVGLEYVHGTRSLQAQYGGEFSLNISYLF